MKRNWDKMKYEKLSQMSVDEISKIEFRNKEVFQKLRKNATITQVKELPFKSNGVSTESA